MKRQIRIAIIGHGAIAEYVVNQVLQINEIEICGLICREPSMSEALKTANGRFSVLTSLKKLDPKPDLLVDCAGHSGLLNHATVALENGVDVISISTGALAEENLIEKLEAAAITGDAKIKFLSGAVGGVDALSSAAVGDLKSVTYVARKPPLGWIGSPAEEKCDLKNLTNPFEHFSGTAREAAKSYPKNANVAATIALASVGLDVLRVKLIADPSVEKNTHCIEADGDFGCLKIQIEGNPLPDNPKSSALAAMSIVAELKHRISRVEPIS